MDGWQPAARFFCYGHTGAETLDDPMHGNKPGGMGAPAGPFRFGRMGPMDGERAAPIVARAATMKDGGHEAVR